MKHRGLSFLLAALLVPGSAFAGQLAAQGDFGKLPATKAFNAASVASAVLADLGANGDEEFVHVRTGISDDGAQHLRFSQRYNGLPVYGADFYIHADADGNMFKVNGSFMAGGDVAFAPSLTAQQAFGATKALRGERTAPELVYVLDADGKAHLAWMAEEVYTNAEGAQRDSVFRSATSGKEVARFPHHHYARVLRTYDCNNGTSCGSLASSSSNRINTGDLAIDSAHNYAVGTYDYFLSAHNRDSIDGNGMTLRSRVHYSNNYNNAFWNGSEMTYGDGDGVTFVPLSQDADVVAHELTHGVTERSSGLIYQNESGALNEAWSDIFGALVDRQEGATGADIWLLGEDIYTPATAGDGLRNMADPVAEGDYDYYPTRYTGSQDNGGVHWNSGIANLAFVLLVEGGTHPRGKTSVNVSGIGFSAAADIFYQANNNCLTASSNFAAARDCTVQFAGSFANNVNDAWDAVGVPNNGGGGGGGGGTCTGNNIWTGTSSSSTPNLVTPNCSASGSFTGNLVCTNGAADLDLYLEKQSCSGWSGCSFGNVASSTSAGCDESVNGYSGSSGTYRWRINYYSGPAEPFTLCTNQC